MAVALIVIPARMQASRLPGKPLADIAGKPMIVHVLERAKEANIGEVLVATDADEIVDAVRDAGVAAILTRADHPSGSDRIHEAARAHGHDGIVINLQGDLPTIDPGAIRRCAEVLDNPAYDIATLANVITEDHDRTDPNVVKVVGAEQPDGTLNALYFTRATAPHGVGPLLHHIGIYAYRAAALDRFIALPPSPLEQRERLEQLRALEAGMRIGVAVVDSAPVGVDTPSDLERVRALLSS